MKTKTKILISAGLIAVLLCSVCFAATEPVQSYYNVDEQYTSVTRVKCYSEGDFYGTFNEFSQANTKLNMHGECRGGVISSYKTTLEMTINDGYHDFTGYSVNISSVSESSRLLTGDIVIPSSNVHGATGTIKEKCYNLSNSSDRWNVEYKYNWVSAREGWDIYEES